MNAICLRLTAFLILGLAAGSGFAGTLPERWVGSYSYQYVMGHRKGDLAPSWTFDLTINADGTCELIWEGFQMDDRISCSAVGSDRVVNIYFAKWSNDDTSDSSDRDTYEPGTRLMQLRQGPGGKLQTKWGALDGAHTLKDGVRFVHYSDQSH
jgi:hypothetical protein